MPPEVVAKSAGTRPNRRRLLRFGFPAALAITAVIAVGVTAPERLVAQNAEFGGCGPHTLRGTCGLVGSGVRGLGPGVTESFATVSMVTYDGTGGFTAVGVSHGQTTVIPGGPPLEDRFVIVDNGREVRTVVISPLTTLAAANLRRK